AGLRFCPYPDIFCKSAIGASYSSETAPKLQNPVIEGLRLAWDNNFRKVAVRVDSVAIISLIRGEDDMTHQHIYREGNFAADYLANFGHGTTRGVHLISLPDCNLSYFLRRDCMGISEPRLIPRY
ncbi:Putative ribonuclease H protein At1g65750, partial [Linum perenne]